ncbi:MAG: hypothetical protein V3T17_19840 [Pseudomonadales bacterium]
MNNTTFFDAVITIMLGAGFGGLAVFYSMKDKLKQLQQVNTSRRIGLLEQVAQHVGKVSHVFSKYASLASEIGPKAERMSAKQERELEELSNQLVEVYEEVSIAESKLLLLGEQRLEKALKLYTSKMALYHKQVYPGRYTDTEKVGLLRKDVTEMREQFYTILSERYDQKLG